MTVSPAPQTDGPAPDLPTRRGRDWAVIRTAVAGSFYLVGMLVMLALTTSSDGDEAVAGLLGIGTQTAHTGIRVVGILSVFAVFSFFHDLVRMFGPYPLYVAMTWFSLVLSYAVATGCALVLAFFTDPVAAHLGDQPDNVRVIAFGVLILFLLFGTTSDWDRLKGVALVQSLRVNDQEWAGTLAEREDEINHELALAGATQNGVYGVRELAGRLAAIEEVLDDAGIHERGVDGVAVLMRRVTEAVQRAQEYGSPRRTPATDPVHTVSAP